MLPQVGRLSARRSPLLLLLLVGASLAGVTPVQAADVRKDSSLALVPADASFYSAQFRTREQLDLVLASKTWKKLAALPTVRKWAVDGWLEATREDGPLGPVLQFLQDKENQGLLEVLADAVSAEVFVYGGPAWADFIATYARASNEGALPGLDALLDKKFDKFTEEQSLGEFRELQKHRASLRVPELVLGFKMSDPKKAEDQFERIEKLLRPLLDAQPLLQGKLKRGKLVGGGTVLTVTLEGKEIPEELLPFKEVESKPGELDDLRKHVQSLRVTFSLGVRSGYLLVGMSGTLADLEKFAGKGKKLAERPEMNRLAEHAGKRITSLGWASQELNRAFLVGGDLQSVYTSLKRVAKRDAYSAEQRKNLEKDLDTLARSSRNWQPTGGVQLAVTWLTAEGYEGLSWDLGDHRAYKGRKLKLLEHLGGNPLFAAAGPIPVVASGSPFPATKALGNYLQLPVTTPFIGLVAVATFEAIQSLDSPAEKKPQVSLTVFRKLCETFTRDILPTLEEGELGLVIDAGWKSRRWLEAIPNRDTPLPMLQPALLIGLKDGDRFSKGIKNTRLTFTEAIEKIGRDKDFLSELIRLAAPESEKDESGTLYLYPLPKEAGVDKQMVPAAGVGPRVAVFSLSKEHTRRLLQPTPTRLSPGFPSEKKDPVALAFLDFPRVVETALPWVEVMSDLLPGTDKKAKEKQVEELRSGLELLKVFQGFQSVSWLDDGVLVTRSRLLFREP